MWKLLRFLKPYRKESICAPLFKLLEVVFELLVPLVVAHMIDSGIGGADKGIIVRSVLLMITLGAVGLASATTAQYFAAKASAGFGANIRYAMMQHIQKRSYAELDQMGTNTMITRITSDVNQVQSGVNMALRLVMRSPFVVIGAMIMAFTVDVKCALIFAAVIPLLAIVVFAIMFGSIPLYQNVQKKTSQISRALESQNGLFGNHNPTADGSLNNYPVEQKDEIDLTVHTFCLAKASGADFCPDESSNLYSAELGNCFSDLDGCITSQCWRFDAGCNHRPV